jgi:DNA-binding NarL/FixJ family response regulator
METIRVIIIDEQPLFREGIRATLQRMGDCQIVGESTDVADVLDIARTCTPDVALIDAGLAYSDPLEIARQIRYLAPRIAIIILTPSEDEERLFQAIKVGAAAYYTRNIIPEELIEAIRKVSHGEFLIRDDVLTKPQIVTRVIQTLRDQKIIADEEKEEEEEDEETKSIYSPLSSREVEILDYIARGNSNKEIAKSLKISDQTVKNHITSILKKLSVNDRTAAVVHALRHGWIKMHED